MNPLPIQLDVSVLFTWQEGAQVYGLALQRDGSIAKVDHDMKVLETMTVEEAKAIKAARGEDPEGFWGTPGKSDFHLGIRNEEWL